MNNQSFFGLPKNKQVFRRRSASRGLLWLIFPVLVSLSQPVHGQLKEITYKVTVNEYTPYEDTVMLHLERGYEFIPMTRLSDNQWKITVDLPKWWNSGIERYKYCRSHSGMINFEDPGEREDGMREVTLDGTTIIRDTIEQWEVTTNIEELIEVTYIVTVNCYTPEDEVVVLHLERGYDFIPMTQISDKQWKVTIKLPNWWSGGTERYKYCRNYMAGGADEDWGNRGQDGFREKYLDASTTIYDTVNVWRWLPSDGVVPEINTSAYLANPPAKLLSSKFMCGTSLPDYWWERSFRPVFHKTLDHIVKNTNSNWVQYNPVVSIVQYFPTPILDRDSVSSGYTSEEDLRKIIEEAHKRGLKIFLNPFAFPINLDVKDPSPGAHSFSFVTEWEAQWRNDIIYYAQIAQEYEVEMLSFMVPHEFDSQEKIDFVDRLYQKLLLDVRAIYKGLIAINYSEEASYKIYDQCDYLIFTLFDYWPFKLTSSTTPTVLEMVTALNEKFNEKYKLAYDQCNKPIVFQTISSSSFNGSVRGDIYWEDVLYWMPDDPAYPVDLQEQADAYEAMLQAICANEWIAGAFSFNYNHWDALDKAPSVRFKPAEKVLAKWWRWILPENVHLTVAGSTGGNVDPGSASFVLKKDTTIVLTATAADGYQFEKWTGDVTELESKSNPLSLKLNTNKLVKANFEKALSETVVLNLVGSNYGSVDPSPASYVLNRDTTVIIRALANDNYEFSKWAGDVTAGQEQSNPLSLHMDVDKTVKALFSLQSSFYNFVADISNQFYLKQNQPNPCKTKTAIQFMLPAQSLVTLTVYNVNGEKVAQLLNDQKESGEHTFIWNNIDLRPGIYLYRLSVQPANSQSFSVSKTMQVF